MKTSILLNRAGTIRLLAVMLCCALIAPVANASEPPAVANVQYCFDSLPGSDNGTTFQVYQEDLEFTADTSALQPGTHTLYMRVQCPPGGEWGPPIPSTITVEPSSANESVAAWEVSIDTPATAGSGTALPAREGMGTQATLNATVDLDGRPLGTRVLYFRARDSAGTWGATFPIVVALEDSHATEQPASLEYSWDKDPATRNWTPMGLSQNGTPVTNHKFSLDMAGIQLGTQTLAMRAIDSSGSPGLPFLLPVAVVPDSLMGITSPASKLVTYAASGGVVIPGTFTELMLGESPPEEHLMMLPLGSAPLGAAEVVSYLVTPSGETSPQIKADFTVVVDGTNGYADWTLTPGYFSPEELLDPLVSGKDADPDKDSVPNLIECALRTHPRASSASAMPRMSLTDGKLSFTFRQVQGGVGQRAFNYTVDGMRYTVEWSYDMAGAWQSGGTNAFEVLSVADNGDGTDTVVVEAANSITNNQPRVFLRLRVVLF